MFAGVRFFICTPVNRTNRTMYNADGIVFFVRAILDFPPFSSAATGFSTSRTALSSTAKCLRVRRYSCSTWTTYKSVCDCSKYADRHSGKKSGFEIRECKYVFDYARVKKKNHFFRQRQFRRVQRDPIRIEVALQDGAFDHILVVPLQRLRPVEHDGNPIVVVLSRTRVHIYGPIAPRRLCTYHKRGRRNNNNNNNNVVRIPAGLFRYQPHNYGEKYKVTRFNGQAVRSRQVTSRQLVVRLVSNTRIYGHVNNNTIVSIFPRTVFSV